MTDIYDAKRKNLLEIQATNAKSNSTDHRKNLMYAIRALPSTEVLDLVSAGIVERTEFDLEQVRTFMRELHDWAWEFEK